MASNGSEPRLAGRVAVITGGGGGIGLATAERFAAEGARVVIADRDPATGTAAAEAVGGRFVVVDVSDAEQVDALFATTVAELGTVDISFHNAGISPADDDSILTTDVDAWQRRAGREPQVRLPVLQGGPADHAAAGEGLDHQHRVVRRGDGLGDVPDLLHRVEGRRARAVHASSACSSPARASG